MNQKWHFGMQTHYENHPPFHGGNRGSNPRGDAKIKCLDRPLLACFAFPAQMAIVGHEKWLTFDTYTAVTQVLACHDCGKPYADFPLDVVVPDETWKAISPTGHEGGILCAECIVRRGARLPGVTVAKMLFE